MTPRQRDRAASDAGTTAPATDKTKGRRKWKKKSPVEIVIEQADKMRAQIAEKERELEDLRLQLAKFEEARKIFETT